MIAVPIGNLGDLSQRAREALAHADELWCEDTRSTQALLNALGLERGGLRRLDQHTSLEEVDRLLGQVASGSQWIGVVSDAGTPGISDPGASIGQRVVRFPEIRMEPVPGPSALVAMISIAGLKGASFVFNGFFPRSRAEALQDLEAQASSGVSPNWIYFESPHRIRETLSVLEEWCLASGLTPDFVFAKELTKIHETIRRGAGALFLKQLQEQEFDPRGEWVFSISLSDDCVKKEEESGAWVQALECLLQAGVSSKTASQVVASHFSIAKNLAYKKALSSQKK